MKWKYIVSLENEAKFIQHKFGDQRVSAKSTIRFYPMSYKTRIDFVKTIYRSEIILSDSVFNIGGLMNEVETAYFVESGGATRELPYLNLF